MGIIDGGRGTVTRYEPLAPGKSGRAPAQNLCQTDRYRLNFICNEVA